MKCENCQIDLTGGQKKFCSLSCSTLVKNKKAKIKKIENYYLNPAICPNCNGTIPYEIKKNKFCSRSCATSFNNNLKQHSPETKQKLRDKATASPFGAILKAVENSKLLQIEYNLNPNVCVICNSNLDYKNRHRKTCSNDCLIELNRKLSIENENVGGYRHKSQLKAHKSIFMGFHMDSGAELYFAKLISKLGIKWIKNDISWKKCFYYKENGKIRKYYPDFYLPQLNLWVEIKGKRYLHENQELRMKSVPNIHLVMNDKINDFIKNVLSG